MSGKHWSMIRTASLSAFGAGLLTCTVAAAQGAPQDVLFFSEPLDSCGPQGAVFARPMGPRVGPGLRGPGAAASTGAPYSGTGTTKVVRSLADGNRIVRTNTMRYARDGQGRTRTEYSLRALGPFALEDSHTMITIEDPVAQKRYMLHPEQRRANVVDTAQEQAMFTKMMQRRAAMAGCEGVEAGATVISGMSVSGTSVMASSSSGPISQTVDAGAGNAIAASGGSFMWTAPVGAPMPLVAGCGPGAQSKKTPPAVSLGERMIEGVKVVGSRHEYEIAAGEIGNEQPIRVRTEQWFSPALGVVVESLHSDPMVGETTYRLSGIRQGEPDAALFRVPANYTTEQMPPPKFEVFERPLPKPQQ